jgi:hypothetical protein
LFRELPRHFLLPDGRRWPGGPDEGVRFQDAAQRLRLISTTNGGPSPLPLSHPGEGFFQCPSRLARKHEAQPSPGGRGQGDGSDGRRMRRDLAGAADGWPLRWSRADTSSLPFSLQEKGSSSALRPPSHARPCGEHPRLGRRTRRAKTWMVGTSPTMTGQSATYLLSCSTMRQLRLDVQRIRNASQCQFRPVLIQN